MLTHNDLKITQTQMAVANLPPLWRPLRIVQISDLHFYEYSDRRYYQRVVDTVNEMDADLLLMTGDVVHYGDKHLTLAQQFLAPMTARYGKFGVLGNHDYYDFSNSHAVEAMLVEAGFEVLRNRAVEIQKNNAGNVQSIWLAGVDDLWCGQPDIGKALLAVPEATSQTQVRPCTLMLAHNPLMFDPIAHYQPKPVDVLFCGHTHAGHVYLPFLHYIYWHVLKTKYRYLWHEKPHPSGVHTTKLYVTSGVGSAAFYIKGKKIRFGFPRFRFNTHPEIAVITLV